uniref:Uncharacterized protein n=1 Tax=Arundo donax TaxID=35708 RepID=A0A0A9C6M2_ARUDO
MRFRLALKCIDRELKFKTRSVCQRHH